MGRAEVQEKERQPPPACSLPGREVRNICLAKSHICKSSFVNTTVSSYILARGE